MTIKEIFLSFKRFWQAKERKLNHKFTREQQMDSILKISIENVKIKVEQLFFIKLKKIVTVSEATLVLNGKKVNNYKRVLRLTKMVSCSI